MLRMVCSHIIQPLFKKSHYFLSSFLRCAASALLLRYVHAACLGYVLLVYVIVCANFHLTSLLLLQFLRIFNFDGFLGCNLHPHIVCDATFLGCNLHPLLYVMLLLYATLLSLNVTCIR